ncbi:MAG: hypothetical protein Q8M19_06775 [Reyranella sp.]|nr:hypothetical protein [Reyranella sp.]
MRAEELSPPRLSLACKTQSKPRLHLHRFSLRTRTKEADFAPAPHGVVAETKAALTTADAPQPDAIADELAADLIVAGAYGYSRQRKWVLGGIINELFAGDRCVLVAH